MEQSKLSVQLYTVREALQDDVPGTMRRIAEIGFTNVEPYNFTGVKGLADALAATGLSAPTAHMGFVGGDLAPIFKAACTLGIGTVIDPRVNKARWQTAEDIAGIAADFNAAAKVAGEYGLAVGYHNHATELESVIGGTTALELFASQLDEGIVLELDTYWAAAAGQDPVKLLGRLGERVTALHVKDGPATMDNKDQVAVGSGTMPIADIINAAPTALRVIELDDSRGDRFEAVADSFTYLVSQNLA
jgi:sugar phosphate isomerase/epimerase